MKILFISHDGSRTGAPMVLLHLISWLKNNSDYQFEVLFLRGGEMVDDFGKYAKTHVLTKGDQGLSYYIDKFYRKVLKINREKKRLERLSNSLGKSGINLIYGNTSNTTKVISTLKKELNVPVIIHSHELEGSMTRSGTLSYFDKTKPFISKYIACSQLVKENMLDKHSIDESKIELIHAFVKPQTPKLTSEEIKNSLGLEKDAIIIGGAGTLHWRKGIDFYLQLAYQVIKSQPDKDICFVWLGGDLCKKEVYLYNFDIEMWGIQDKVKLIGNKTNPWDYLNAFDMLVMTSREDPFPLVCIEAATLSKPIVCFNRGVGSAEFIDNQVSYLDLFEMTEAVNELINSPEKRNIQGQALKERVSTFTLENMAPKVLSVIDTLIKQA